MSRAPGSTLCFLAVGGMWPASHTLIPTMDGQYLQTVSQNKSFFPSVAFLFKGEHLPFAEQEQNRLLNLFNDFRVDEKFARQICEVITTCYK